jgi:pteridine reductase
MTLKDKVAFITGAGVRVGKSIAVALAARGVKIAFTHLPGEEDCLAETMGSIEGKGVDCIALPMDVRLASQPSECVERVLREFGQIDILINNASQWFERPFLDISLSEWNEALAVNLTGPFLCSQAVAPNMLARRSGSIINMLDLSALQTWPNSSHHSTTKAGLLALTRAMAFELAPWVRVNGIAPGSVLLPDECSRAKEEWAVNNSLLKRIGSPEDVAKTVIFLLESEFVTGAVYFVDGGRSIFSSSMTDHRME